MSQQQKGNRIAVRVTLLITLVALVSAALWYWREPLRTFFGNQELVRDWITDFGPWGPVVSIALNVAQVLVAPIPGQLLGLVNGYLYGMWPGLLYSMIGLTLGTALAMGLGRWFGRPLVRRLVNPKTLARWDRIADRQGPRFFFLVFLLPFLPDDVTCFIVGLSPLSIPRMLLLVTPARLPGVFVSCWLGAYATELPWWAWIPLGGGAAGLAWIMWSYQPQLDNLLAQWLQHLTQRTGVKLLERHRGEATPESSGGAEENSTSPGANRPAAGE
ncbi:MAG: hypothetical protein DRI48_03030 [Chloroflexi bacterium]|nr:MAG: hypothetical protein DRI48_03030 [Chloroflexota bacterium]